MKRKRTWCVDCACRKGGDFTNIVHARRAAQEHMACLPEGNSEIRIWKCLTMGGMTMKTGDYETAYRKDPAAVALGSRGGRPRGSRNRESVMRERVVAELESRKAWASRMNGLKGGRPRRNVL